MAKSVYKNIKLVQPPFESPLTNLVIELEHLRKKRLEGNTHRQVFFQISGIFQMLESIWSANIKGNRTTISEYLETILEDSECIDGPIQEIRNIEEGINFIDENTDNLQLGQKFIGDLHKIVVKRLHPSPDGEGDKTLGVYRNCSAEIRGASHTPPETKQQIEHQMQELFCFLNTPHSPKYDFLKMAIAHHRFMWIHPFRNGNGRVGRLLTYALFVKAGFNVSAGRILNPTTAFRINEAEYFKFLSEANTGKDSDLLNWCTYVLKGLKSEIDTIDRLSDYSYLKKSILLPALECASKMRCIDSNEHIILKVLIERQVVQNSDIREVLKERHITSISRDLRALKSRKIILSEAENTRKYHINLTNNFLMRSVINTLKNEGFIPIKPFSTLYR